MYRKCFYFDPFIPPSLLLTSNLIQKIAEFPSSGKRTSKVQEVGTCSPPPPFPLKKILKYVGF